MGISVEIRRVARPSTVSEFRSNWNSVEMLVKLWREENRSTRRKALGARMRTNNKLNPHMTLGPRFKPGPLLVGVKRSHHCAIPAPQLIVYLNERVHRSVALAL